ncbi:MAG TPA: carbohydrate porin [Candidatus Saccharimonadales bacterium]|nr:carbohydrate porin [Candidatus Saccharimonadales bacterium]
MNSFDYRGNVMPRRTWFHLRSGLTIYMIAIFLACVALGKMAVAQDSTVSDEASVESPGASSFLTRPHMFGEWGGLRGKLAEQDGVNFDFQVFNELLANPIGGYRYTQDGFSRVRGTLDIDLNKLVGVKNTRFHITGVWQNGGAMILRTGSLADAQGYFSASVTRLDSWWVQEDLFKGHVNLFVGQIAGMDFFTMNFPPDTYNWVTNELLYNLQSRFQTGLTPDPASTPAAVVKVNLPHHFYVMNMAQVGPGCLNPAKPCYRSPYDNDPGGYHFKFNGGGLWNSEVGYSGGLPIIRKEARERYAGLYRFSATYNGTKFENFNTEKFESGNYNVAFMANQPLFRPVAKSNKGIDLRFGFALTPSDLNKLNQEYLAAVQFPGLIPGRPKDLISIGFHDYVISGAYNNHLTSLGTTRLTSEKEWEINYSYWPTPWLQFMPVVEIFKDLGARSGETGLIAGFSTRWLL